MKILLFNRANETVGTAEIGDARAFPERVEVGGAGVGKATMTYRREGGPNSGNYREEIAPVRVTLIPRPHPTATSRPTRKGNP